MYLKQTVAPTYKPLSRTEVKNHLKVDVTNDDTLIDDLISAAVEFVEDYTGLQLMPATWVLYLDDFASVTYLNKAPVQTFVDVKYYDTDGTLQTLDSAYYDPDMVSEPARIREAYGYSWPTAYEKMNAVMMTFWCGFSASNDSEDAQQAAVPADIKQAMLLFIQHNYDNRGDEGHRKLPQAIYDLLDKKRLFWL